MQTKKTTKQNIGQAYGGGHMRHIATAHYLYGIDQGHPQRHSQAMVGRRKRCASVELSLSSGPSRLTDVHKRQ